MFSERISRALRRRVQERANGLCEYCQALPISLVPLFTVNILSLENLEAKTPWIIWHGLVLGATPLSMLKRMLAIRIQNNAFHFLTHA